MRCFGNRLRYTLLGVRLKGEYQRSPLSKGTCHHANPYWVSKRVVLLKLRRMNAVLSTAGENHVTFLSVPTFGLWKKVTDYKQKTA